MNIIPLYVSSALHVNSAPLPKKAADTAIEFFRDKVTLSDEIQAKLAGMETATASLEQAAVQYRQQTKQAAKDRVSMAHEYLKLLQRMSLPNDPATAREAARAAREIHAASESYRGSLTSDGEVSAAKETAAFVSEAGKGLTIAKGIIEHYLKNKKETKKEDSDMKDAVDTAFRSLHGLIQDGIMAGLKQL